MKVGRRGASEGRISEESQGEGEGEEPRGRGEMRRKGEEGQGRRWWRRDWILTHVDNIPFTRSEKERGGGRAWMNRGGAR